MRFQVARDGAATDITLFGGSREPDLRAAALASIKAASPFKPLPTELSEEALTVEVPIVFELEDE
ncbi:Gram-negative bacterial tonB protein [compost metagenome]